MNTGAACRTYNILAAEGRAVAAAADRRGLSGPRRPAGTGPPRAQAETDKPSRLAWNASEP